MYAQAKVQYMFGFIPGLFGFLDEAMKSLGMCYLRYSVDRYFFSCSAFSSSRASFLEQIRFTPQTRDFLIHSCFAFFRDAILKIGTKFEDIILPPCYLQFQIRSRKMLRRKTGLEFRKILYRIASKIALSYAYDLV